MLENLLAGHFGMLDLKYLWKLVKLFHLQTSNQKS
jgi:hypothetical protein